jgi:hypothetical protein
MNDKEGPPRPKRHYPPLYEKVIPIALGVVVVVIVVLLLVVGAVILGVFPGGR